MLRQQCSTLLKLARRQKLIQPPVSRNQSSGIVMTAIHQHHPHAQLANQLLIKRLQTPVAVEADQQSVKLQIEFDGTHPVPILHRLLIALKGIFQLGQHIGVVCIGCQHRRDFQHPAQVINLLDIFQRELGYGDAAMNAALEQPFERKNAGGFPHGVARDAERSCQRDFLEWHSRAQLAFQNPLAQDGRDLIRNTDPVNLRALHENVDWERNAKSRAILLPLCSRCQVLNNSMSYHIRNVPGLSTIEMSPGYHAGEKAGVSYSASLVSKDDCRQESDEACLPQ